MTKQKHLTYQEALTKLEKYCAYRERCHSEVRRKLITLGVRGQTVEEIISHLIQEKFLDETRYAMAFARGKLRMNQWGWQKIRSALRQKGISDYDLKRARAEIDNEYYDELLRKILEKKDQALHEENPNVRKHKLYRFAAGRGFEPEKILRVLNRLLN